MHRKSSRKASAKQKHFWFSTTTRLIKKWSCIMGKNGGLMFVPTVSQAAAAVGSVCLHSTPVPSSMLSKQYISHPHNWTVHTYSCTMYSLRDEKVIPSPSTLCVSWTLLQCIFTILVYFHCYCPCSLSPSGQSAVLLIPCLFFSACPTKLYISKHYNAQCVHSVVQFSCIQNCPVYATGV